MTSLRFDDVSVRLGDRLALDHVSAELGPGWTAIVGANGAGKSTLLRVGAGLLAPAAGTVRVGADPVQSLSPRTRARQLAWLAQHGEASDELTVRQIVGLGRLPQLGLLGSSNAEDERHVEHALAEAGCSGWQDRHLDQLSGGERQRVFVARMLAADANWLLLDEPTTHLDPPQQVALIALLRRLAASGRGVVTVLHDLSLAMLADRLLVLDQGRLRADGHPDDLALQRALIETFTGAIRIERCAGRWAVLAEVGS